MIETLAFAITLQMWQILLIITTFTFIIASILDEKSGGGYIDIPGFSIMWLFGNLIMWLIYFIVV